MRPTLNTETAACWKWLTTTEGVGDECNLIVREVLAHAHVPGSDKVAEIAARIAEEIHGAFPAIIRPGEPADWREKMRQGLERVDWSEIALLFIEQERWRAKGRALRNKRKGLRRKRK